MKTWRRRDGLGSILVGLAATALVLAREPAAEWPQFRGPGGQGISRDTALPLTWGQDRNLVWKTALPGPGTSGPVIVGGRIFLTCFTGYGVPGRGGDLDDLRRHVLCLDLDGKVLWNKEVTTQQPEQARIREDHGYASSTPAADGEGLYVFFGKSGVFAFDHDGRQQWHADVGSGLHGWGSATSPVIYQNLVLVNASVESESLVALDRKTGKEVWRAKGIHESWNTPLLVKAGDRTEVVVAVMGEVLGFDPTTGEQLWSCATDIGWYMVPSLVAHDGVVYCIGGRDGGGALAVRTGGKGDVTRTHRLWMVHKGSNVPSPLYHDGHVYWVNDNVPVAYCAEAKTGKIVYEERVAGASQFYASPLLANGKIYYVARGGRTFVVAARPQYQLLASNDLRDRSTFNASPAAAGGRLYLRSDKFLYCVGTK